MYREISFNRLLAEELPDFFMRRLLPALEKAYEDAEKRSKGYSAPLQLEALSHVQGWSVQQQFFNVSSSFSESGVKPAWVPNSRQREHIEVYTPALTMTCHRVPAPSVFPRDALYRKNNAAMNMNLLPGFPDVQSDGETYLFVLHGPSIDNPFRLGFVQLAVPDAVERRFLATTIVFANEEFKPARIEEIPDTAVLKIRQRAVQKNE